MISIGHDIGAVDDYENGIPYHVKVKGQPLVVVRKGDIFFALRDTCPHEGARLSDGRVLGTPLTCKPGNPIDYGRKGEIISCPWHGWEFDLCTGRSLTKPDRVRVKSYSVTIENGRVLVDTGNNE